MHFQFTTLVKTSVRVREFNFTKPSMTSENVFHVDVSDDRGNRIMFKMQKEEKGLWKIAEQELPPWIWEVEEKLSAAIEEQLR